MATVAPPRPEPAHGLALAVVASSYAPLVLLDGDLKVIGASTSFYDAFEIEPDGVAGRLFTGLGAGEWDSPRIETLLAATLAGDAEVDIYEMDLVRAGVASRRLVLHAQKLDYPDAGNVRLVLSIADVTGVRAAEKAKDDLLREKAVLLQELQHRVANSLQIIASVLLQSAKRVHSDETRRHLYDAHQRVMSVASVQRQLAVTRLGEVELKPYFNDLCESLGSSMIRDHKQLVIEVDADQSVTSAEDSVSLGLIITELVINSLKHAFPGRRHGKITVGYRSNGGAWTLSVGDNGVGLPADPTSAKSGLGTSIVEALAKQLGAKVVVSVLHPGTTTSIARA